MSLCLIALGANIGEKEKNVRRAIELIGLHDSIQVLQSSQIHLTEPVGGPQGQDSFANAAILAETGLSPIAILRFLLEIELVFGRQRDVRWQARTLDLDLLLYDELTISNDRFVLPHPRMSFRRFVLEPCAEIAADMVHPVAEMTIGELLEAINLRPALISIRAETPYPAVQLAHSVCQKTNTTTFWPGLPGESSNRDVKTEFAAWEQIERFLTQQNLPPAAGGSLIASRELPYVICVDVAGLGDQLEQHSRSPRLAVALLDCQEKSADGLQMKAKRRMLSNYRGPFLIVDLQDLEIAAVELIAAMEAMR